MPREHPMTSAASKPPLASTRLRLPFDQLSPGDFERLCLWLVRREGFADVELLGEAGTEQGRDVVARHEGRRFAFQCKRVQRFTAADARREIAKVRRLPAGEQPEVYVFVVSKAVRADTRRLAREAWGDAEACRFWCGSELDERVKRHPEVLEEFFDLGQGRRQRGADTEPPELTAYRDWARERYEGLSLLGVGAGDVRLKLEEVFVPLRISRRPILDFDQRGTGRRSEMARQLAEGDVELEDIFALEGAGSLHTVIFGEPGAGKTTALVKLHQQCLSAADSLGLPTGTVPVLLPLRRLAAGDLDQPLAVAAGKYLEELSEGRVTADLAERLWQRGHLLLLLDGLDEIADDQRRAEVAAYLEWQVAAAASRQVRAVVSCRYAGYGGQVRLDEGFLHLDVRPLDAAQVRRLVRLWFREAQRAVPGFPPAEARQRAEDLVSALEGRGYASQQLKVLVSSPLLLTLLCVIVLRGGEMPRQRVEFYDQCLRVLLRRWRRAKGIEPLLDVETALAVLRPIAWRLHADARRDDFSRAELVNQVRKRLRDLGHEASPFRVADWLHRETGVLEEYAPQRYGFMHLGLQEYLAAAHAASRGEELLDRLAAEFGERWWQEVVLLLVALPGRRVFRLFMERVLAAGALEAQEDLLRRCLAEAPEVDVEPFLGPLADGAEPARQAVVLRLLRGRCDARLLERAEQLAASPAADVAALARRLVEECRSEPQAAGRRACDLFLAHGPEAAAAAAELAASLAERDVLRLFAGPHWESDLEGLLASTRAAAVLVGPGARAPWERPELEACLELFDAEDRPLVPVLLPGAGAKPELPESVRWLPWIDLRGLSAAAACEAVERIALRAEAEPAAVPAPIAIHEAPAAGRSFREPATGIRLLGIPGGRFRMGGKGIYGGTPIHRVAVSPFWLGETPVTNRQYSVFLEETKAEEPALWRDRRFSDAEQPVVGVSWQEAVAFCEWISGKLGLAASLPSEAQWEYAARSQDGRDYPWGDEDPDAKRACFDLDYREGKPARVGSYPAGRGPFGTLDQAGNVWEWCLDVWDEDAYQKRSKGENLDPVVAEGEGEVRVLRGGGWSSPAVGLRAACRSWGRASGRDDGIGFRVSAAPASP